MQKSFYVTENNGQEMVIETLQSLGMVRLADKSDLSYFVKWVERRSDIDFGRLKEGQQIVNHIANNFLFTTKNGLFHVLKDHERARKKKDPSFSIAAFVPETYRMDVAEERTALQSTIQREPDGTAWIIKPSNMNQGRGITIKASKEELKEICGKKDGALAGGATSVVQRYMKSPLLLDGRKFDMRIYMLIAKAANPALVFYHEGYCRLSHEKFEMGRFDNLQMHLTNAAVQRKHPDHKEKGEETIWAMDELQQYLSMNSLAPGDWVSATMVPRVQEIMKIVFESIRDKVDRRRGQFDLIGCDFMVDADLNVWLIECNSNPALWRTCKVTKALLPPMISEVLNIAIEIHEKERNKKEILPLTSQNEFVTLISS